MGTEVQRMTAEARYDSLTSSRAPALRRAREASQLTIPSLIPPENTSGDHGPLYTPFQSIGAQGVNHLASKLLLALFPPNGPFFKLSINEKDLEELEAMPEVVEAVDNGDVRGAFEKALSKAERIIKAHMERKGARTTLSECFKHLLVAGNALLEVLDKGGLRLHPLSKYVVKRDKAGNAVEIVIKESVSRLTLPEKARVLVELNEIEEPTQDKNGDDSIDLYTRVSRTEDKWEVHQEIVGEVIPDSEGTYPLDRCPFLPLRLVKVDGEDYGRGRVEEFIGDLQTLEGLTQSIVEFSAAAAKVLIFVEDNARTDKDEVATSASGSVLEGNADDISVFQLEKYADFQVAKAVVDDTRKRLQQAFLLMSSVQRDAERVTASEVHAVVNELEQALGGIYSVLAQELQAPLVRVVMNQLMKAKELPRLPLDSVHPEIITGVDALGRASDYLKLKTLVADVAQLASANEAITDYISIGALFTRGAASLGLDIDGVVRSDEDAAKLRQERAEQKITQAVAPVATREAMAQANNTTETAGGT